MLARFTRAGLIAAQEDTFVLTHEAIARAWPRMAGWLEEEAEDERLAQQLTAAAQRWQQSGMPDSDLYRGARLAAVEAWAAEGDHPRTADEAAFIRASARAADAERSAATERAARDRRSNRRLRVALASAAVLLVGSLAATGVVVTADAAATAAQTDASITSLLATSLALRSSSRDVSALLAAQMWRQWPDDPRSRTALLDVVTGSGGLVETSYLDADWIAGEIIPGTTSIVLNRGGSALEVRDAVTGDVTAVYAPADPTDQLTQSMAVSADGTIAAVVVVDDATAPALWSIDLFDARTLRPLRTPMYIDDQPSDVAVSADGRLVAAIGANDATLFVADIFTGAVRRTVLPSLPIITAAPRASLSFTPDGLIAVGSVLPELTLFDPFGSDAPPALIEIPGFAANSDSFVTSDGVLVAGGERAWVAVDLKTHRTLWSHALQATGPAVCAHVAGSAARGKAYCADSDRGAVEFDLATGDPTGRTFDSQLGGTGALALSDDGATLIVVGSRTPTLSVFRTDRVDRDSSVDDSVDVRTPDADAQRQFTAACRIAGRELTDAEWGTYLSWLPDRVDACAGVLR